MVSEDRVRAVFDAVRAKLESVPRDSKTASAWMERFELLVVSGALGWVLGGTGDRLRSVLALHGIELPEGEPAAVPVEVRRNGDGTVDEVLVGDPRAVHLEQMAPNAWCLLVTRANGERVNLSLHAGGETVPDPLERESVPRVDVVIVEGDEQAAPVPVGEWTAESPTVPGWYWWRERNGAEPVTVRVRGAGVGDLVGVGLVPSLGLARQLGSVKGWVGEWWTIPIQPPGA